MICRKLVASIAAAVAFLGVGFSSAQAAGKFGEAAPDFPPGVFSDGGRYQLEDFRGKVVVLYFYESTCPRCRGMVPERNKLLLTYKDKPVKFLAIQAHDPMAGVAGYVQGTRIAMPVFADPLRVMEKRYGENISLSNIYQFKIIGPKGDVAGYAIDQGQLDKVIATVEWKFKGNGYDPALAQAIELLEWNRFEAGMKALAPLRKNASKTVAASAEKLFGEMKTEGQAWKAEADKLVESKPEQAYDLYTRITACFPGDELSKSVEEPLKKLKADAAVKDELEARRLYGQLVSAMGKAGPNDKAQVAAFCKNLVTKYPKTPTGEKVAAFLAELGG